MPADPADPVAGDAVLRLALTTPQSTGGGSSTVSAGSGPGTVTVTVTVTLPG